MATVSLSCVLFAMFQSSEHVGPIHKGWTMEMAYLAQSAVAQNDLTGIL